MPSKIIESIALFSTKDGADKEYRVQLSEEPAGFMVTGFNGRRGSALKAQPKTPAPVPYDVAKKAYDTLVKSKLKDGYTPGNSGADYVPPADVGVPTGIALHLLKQVPESDIDRYINDSAWCAQEKHDGERRPVSWDGQSAIGSNKRGFQCALVAAAAKVLSGLPAGTTLDTEQVGDTLFAFDVMESGSRSLRDNPYQTRMLVLSELVNNMGEQSCVVAVETAIGTSAKRALYERLRATRKEGICFKRLNSAYGNGENDDQIKIKFTESCTVQVASVHPTKRSIGVQAVKPDGSLQFLGNVTIPANHVVPGKDDLVEVEYLYVVNKLVQPVFKGPRPDQTLASCSTSKLKYRAGIGDDEPVEEDPELLAA